MPRKLSEFQGKFAAAERAGLKTFTYKGKKYAVKRKDKTKYGGKKPSKTTVTRYGRKTYADEHGKPRYGKASTTTAKPKAKAKPKATAKPKAKTGVRKGKYGSGMKKKPCP